MLAITGDSPADKQAEPRSGRLGRGFLTALLMAFLFSLLASAGSDKAVEPLDTISIVLGGASVLWGLILYGPGLFRRYLHRVREGTRDSVTHGKNSGSEKQGQSPISRVTSEKSDMREHNDVG